MKVFKSRSKRLPELTREQALACIPVKSRNVEATRLESGEALVSYPLALRPWLQKLSRKLGRAPEQPRIRRLHLDALGTEVWDLIDGRRRVRRIIEKFAAARRLHLRESEVAVTQFLRELGRRGIIGMRQEQK